MRLALHYSLVCGPVTSNHYQQIKKKTFGTTHHTTTHAMTTIPYNIDPMLAHTFGIIGRTITNVSIFEIYIIWVWRLAYHAN